MLTPKTCRILWSKVLILLLNVQMSLKMERFHLFSHKNKHAQTADQVGDRAKIDELVHLQIIQSAWCGDHYVHPVLHQVDLAPPISSAIDADTERRYKKINNNHIASTSWLISGSKFIKWLMIIYNFWTFCSLYSSTCCTQFQSAGPALWWESRPTCLDHPAQL